MTKPTPPQPQRPPSEIVEIDAMDVMEWQHGQRTPQASDANLAALVKQSARAHESAPVHVASEAARQPSLVARPTKPTAAPRPAALPSGTDARPAMRASGTGVRAPEPRPTRRQGSNAEPAEETRLSRPARAGSKPGVRAGTAFPPIGTPPPTDAGQLPNAVGGYPIYTGPAAGPGPITGMTPAPLLTPGAMAAVAPVPTAQTPMAMAPSGLPALYVPDHSDTPAMPAPVVRPQQFERPPSQDPLAISNLSPAPTEVRRLREGARTKKQRRLWWLAGAGGLAAAVLGVALAVATEAPAPQADAPPPETTAAAAPTARAPGEAKPSEAKPATGEAKPTTGEAKPAPSETKPSIAAVVTPAPAPAAAGHAPEPGHAPAPARVAAAIPAPARPAPSRPARRPKKIVVDYQTRADEAPVPGLVAQASEDPAIARARTAYLTGNDKLFAGDAAAAVTAYREALGVYPGYVGGYRGLGLAYAQLGDTKQALEALKAYVTAAPTAKDVALIKKRIARLQGK